MKPPDFEHLDRVLATAEPIETYISPERAFVLVGLLQLALRHPGLADTKKAQLVGREMAQRLQQRLGEIDPAIGLILEQGWHPEWDMSKEEFDRYMDSPDELHSPDEPD